MCVCVGECEVVDEADGAGGIEAPYEGAAGARERASSYSTRGRHAGYGGEDDYLGDDQYTHGHHRIHATDSNLPRRHARAYAGSSSDGGGGSLGLGGFSEEPPPTLQRPPEAARAEQGGPQPV